MRNIRLKLKLNTTDIALQQALVSQPFETGDCLSIDSSSVSKGLTVSHAGLSSRQGIQPASKTRGKSIVADV
jgi:hypothetical protein